MTVFTKAELRTIVRESETMATLLSQTGTMLSTHQVKRVAYLLRESARYNRLALTKGKGRDLPEGATG